MLFRALGSEIFNLDPVGTTSRGWATARQVSNCFLGLTAFPELKTRRQRLLSRGTENTLQRLKADLCFLLVLSPVPPAVDPLLNFLFCTQEQYSLLTVFLHQTECNHLIYFAKCVMNSKCNNYSQVIQGPKCPTALGGLRAGNGWCWLLTA